MPLLTQRRTNGAAAPTPVEATSSTKDPKLRGMNFAEGEAALAPGGDKDAGGADPLTDGSAWAEAVRRNFSKWDADGDGRITAKEADKRIKADVDPGLDGIALVGLRAFMEKLAALSKDPGAVGVSEKDLDVYAQGYPDATPEGLERLDARFAEYAANTKAEGEYGLYGSAGKPDGKLLQQGQIGTCYFLGPLISLAERDPDAICAMIEEHPAKDGGRPSYTVTFPGQTPITVTLDDDLLVKQTTTKANGVWAAVMERAFIAHNWAEVKDSKHEERKGEVKSAELGYAKEGIELLTGNSAKQTPLKGKSLKKLDALLAAAFKKGALVNAGINLQWWKAHKNRPLTDRHIYAVIGYSGGKVTIRNPHGADRNGELKDAEGKVKDGTDDGEFTIDLEEFRKMFSNVTIEQK